MNIRQLWSPKALILFTGLAFGILASFLVKWGNPPNMGYCAACFIRDMAGALGLQKVATLQYLRPEIIGLALGAVVAAVGFREFRPRGGSSPLIRFFLGAFAMVGALVFLGCPVRLLLRLGGGDLGAIFGLVGLVGGVGVGVLFLKNGFSLGRTTKTLAVAGWVMPATMVGLLLLAIFVPTIISASKTGPASMHPALWISLAVGLGIGFLAQRTRLCTVGGWRDLFLVRDYYLFLGIIGIFVGVLITNYALGFFNPSSALAIHYQWGFTKQPIALPGVDANGVLRWTDYLWGFLGLGLLGLAATMAGGCPLRQVVLSSEGDTDAGVTVLGLVAGGAFAQNFLISSSATGTGQWGPAAVIIGFIFCLVIGFSMREKATA